MTSRTLRLLPSGQTVPLPRRIEAEPIAVHEARVAAVKRLGVKWLQKQAEILEQISKFQALTFAPAESARSQP